MIIKNIEAKIRLATIVSVGCLVTSLLIVGINWLLQLLGLFPSV